MFDPSSPITKTPAMGCPSVVVAVPALFDKEVLKDEVAVESMICSIERHLADRSSDLDDTLSKLMQPGPHVLAFVLSAVNDETFYSLSAAILERFPKTPRDFTSSLAANLLSHLPLFYLFLPSSAATEVPAVSVRMCRRETESAISALEALRKLRFGSEDHDGVQDELSDEFADFEFAVKRKGQGKRKQAKRGQRGVPSVDTKAITSYGAKVPRTQGEAELLYGTILASQKTTLQTYLGYLRLPSVALAARTAFLPPPPETESTPAVLDGAAPEADLDQDDADVPAAYPLVQPMKAALYFDSAEGFGEWRILISTRADRNLRQARRGDAKLFKIFVKKIKELSNGHFSDDNQKRLTGLDVEIPIYEAKMTGDTRLVYQVDCIPEFESDVERQVLKIFGIYTHAQLDRRFWDCMGRQLERKGVEYKKRCTFRNPPVIPGDKVFMPASWPPPVETLAYEPAPVIMDMRKEDYEELHSLLVLEKFVTFSQALLNSE